MQSPVPQSPYREWLREIRLKTLDDMAFRRFLQPFVFDPLMPWGVELGVYAYVCPACGYWPINGQEHEDHCKRCKAQPNNTSKFTGRDILPIASIGSILTKAHLRPTTMRAGTGPTPGDGAGVQGAPVRGAGEGS